MSTADRTIIDAHLAVIDEVNEQIEAVEELIEQHFLETAAQMSLTIPGVGQATAAVVDAELGEIARFDSHEAVVSYAGLDQVIHQSGDTEIHGSISKEGPGTIRWPLVPSAHVAIWCSDYFGNFYTRLKLRKNAQIAVVATAQKMLVLIILYAHAKRAI